MAVVTEDWTQWTFARGRSSQRVFLVSGLSLNAGHGDAIDAVKADPAGVTVGDALPFDNRLIVAADESWNVDRQGLLYKVTVTYVPLEFYRPDNPLDQKWNVQIDRVEETFPAEHDASGNPFVSSGGMPFERGLPRTISYLKIRMQRYESSFNLALADTYANKVNSDSVTLPKLGTAVAGELLCRSITVADEFSPDTDVLAVVYNFEARPRWAITESSGAPTTYVHGWHERVMDEGTEGVRNDGSSEETGVPIYFTSHSANAGMVGQQVDSPVRLNGYGVPISDRFRVGDLDNASNNGAAVPPATLDVTSDAVFLMYDPTRGMTSFAGLNIAANN